MEQDTIELKPKKSIGKKIWLAIGWATPAILSIVILLILPHTPWISEYIFARGISHFLNNTIGYVISLIPISFTEILIVLAGFSVIFLLVSLIVSFFPKKKKESEEKTKEEQRAEDLKMFRICGWILTSIFLFYVIGYGGVCSRYPLAKIMQANEQEYTTEDLYHLCCDLADRASELRKDVQEDGNGNMVFSESTTKTLGQAGDGYFILDDTYSFLKSPVHRCKGVLLSHYWSYTGIEGVYFPIFMETNANIDIPDFAIPSSAAHEQAHLRGFSREDEANYLGFRSCFVHPSKDYQYSGYASAYIYCSNQLFAADKELWKKAESHCSEAVSRDFYAYNEYWKQFEGKFQDTSLSWNDVMIKFRGVEDGSQSYDRVVDLLMYSYLDGSICQ